MGTHLKNSFSTFLPEVPDKKIHFSQGIRKITPSQNCENGGFRKVAELDGNVFGPPRARDGSPSCPPPHPSPSMATQTWFRDAPLEISRFQAPEISPRYFPSLGKDLRADIGRLLRVSAPPCEPAFFLSRRTRGTRCWKSSPQRHSARGRGGLLDADARRFPQIKQKRFHAKSPRRRPWWFPCPAATLRLTAPHPAPTLPPTLAEA